jgi:hypothetical protein
MIELVGGIGIPQIDIGDTTYHTTLSYSRRLWRKLELVHRQDLENTLMAFCEALYPRYMALLVRWNEIRKPQLDSMEVGVELSNQALLRLYVVTVGYVMKPLSVYQYDVKALGTEDGQREVSAYTVFVLGEERNQYMLDAVAPGGQQDIWFSKMRNLI